MISLGKLSFACGAALAPMAGATDATMRRLCAEHGAVSTVSEMVSAKALTMGDTKSPRLMAGGGGSAPYGIQLFGAEVSSMGEAAAMICGGKYRVPFDFLDINMGCPAPKITGGGAGSALLKTPALAGEIAAAVVKSAAPYHIPVTAKMRIGWDGAQDTWTGAEVAKRCEAAGVALLTVHGRTRAEMYEPGIHADAIAAIRQAVHIPVLANGDVTSADDALLLLRETGCAGIAVGRGAMGNPWLFAQIAAALRGDEIPAPPTLSQRLAVLRRHIYDMCEDKGEFVAMQQARTHAAWYMHGLHGAAALRRECCSLSCFAELDEVIAHARALQKEG
ncbi:MAG: tRNA dihydrouridine synthase DusB [Ruthenibacterium sp.]